jgi:anti-sigma B factor antagonist
MAGEIMSTEYVSGYDLAGHDAELPLLSLAVACGPVTVIELSGDVDMDTTHLITELVGHVVEKRPSQVVFDMTKVSFFCAAGITVLLRAHKTIKDAGGELLLRRPSRITLHVLTVTRTADTFQIDGHSV